MQTVNLRSPPFLTSAASPSLPSVRFIFRPFKTNKFSQTLFNECWSETTFQLDCPVRPWTFTGPGIALMCGLFQVNLLISVAVILRAFTRLVFVPTSLKISCLICLERFVVRCGGWFGFLLVLSLCGGSVPHSTSVAALLRSLICFVSTIMAAQKSGRHVQSGMKVSRVVLRWASKVLSRTPRGSELLIHEHLERGGI